MSLLVTALFSGCRSDPVSARPESHAPSSKGIRLIEEWAIAAPGQTLITPVQFGSAPTAPVTEVRFSDGRIAPAFLARFDAALGDADEWLGDRLDWMTQVLRPSPTLAPSSSPAGIAGFWALVVETPPDARSTGFEIAGQSLRVVWRRPDSEALPPRSPLAQEFTTAEADALEAHLAFAAMDPALRWRVALLSDQLDGAGRCARAALVRATPKDDLVRALAAQTELRWRTALARLARAEPETAGAVRDRLCSVARIGRRWVPAWPDDTRSLDALLEALSDPGNGAEPVRAAGRAWLRSQPPFTARVLDDAASVTADGIEARVEVVDRGAQGGTARVEAPPSGEALARWRSPGADMPRRSAGPRVELAPTGTAVAACRAAPAHVDATALERRRELEVRVSDAVATLPAWCEAIPVRPPGAALGPLLATLTLADWQRGGSSPARADWCASVLLQRSADDRGWELYVECRVPALREGDEATDRVRLHFGPRDAPIGVCVVDVVDGAGACEFTIAGERRTVVSSLRREPDRWSTIVPLPDAIAGGPLLLIGLERVCSAGRFTWPRALTAWEESPGRVALDLSTWNRAPSVDGEPPR